MGKFVSLTGKVFTRLTVHERVADAVMPTGKKHAQYRCVCSCGQEVTARADHLRDERVKSCGCLKTEVIVAASAATRWPHWGEANQQWSGDDASYRAVHKRLKRRRGFATDFDCVDCGEPATDWSYLHGAPDERIGDDGRGKMLAYSLDLDYYAPRCKVCHRRYDTGYSAA